MEIIIDSEKSTAFFFSRCCVNEGTCKWRDTLSEVGWMAIKTHLNISPLDDNFILFAKEKRIKAQMIHTQVHPTLAGHTVFPIATGIIFWKRNAGKDQVRLRWHRMNPIDKCHCQCRAILTADEFFFSWHAENFLESMDSCDEVG